MTARIWVRLTFSSTATSATARYSAGRAPVTPAPVSGIQTSRERLGIDEGDGPHVRSVDPHLRRDHGYSGTHPGAARSVSHWLCAPRSGVPAPVLEGAAGPPEHRSTVVRPRING